MCCLFLDSPFYLIILTLFSIFLVLGLILSSNFSYFFSFDSYFINFFFSLLFFPCFLCIYFVLLYLVSWKITWFNFGHCFLNKCITLNISSKYYFRHIPQVFLCSANFLLFIQQTLIEHLLCSKDCSNCWENNSEWSRRTVLSLTGLIVNSYFRWTKQKMALSKEVKLNKKIFFF